MPHTDKSDAVKDLAKLNAPKGFFIFSVMFADIFNWLRFQHQANITATGC